MSHDRHCPITSTPADGCPICALLEAARREERSRFTATWKQNLPRIESRNYLDGYQDASNGRPIPEWARRGSLPVRRP